ncbi:hypothetical protein SCMU_18250 [Sinomonas cyclohexanicum]|uniref:Helix-turn-helix domain-containing protein n=1 Tax=Sinomonas cyclohexanicum TaxID=322009 RepID=A0ABM7PUP9_SINCY|nr:hypothetical protein SCMU_18250 [Corynebacterium cyclohexanicum]
MAFYLATYANTKTGRGAHPGVTQLAEDSGMSTRTVMRHLQSLEDLGLVVCVRRGSDMGRKAMTSVYDLAIPEDPEHVSKHQDHVTPVSHVDPSDQVTPMSHDQVPPVSHDRPEQVTPVTGTGDTGVTPTLQELPSSNSPTAVKDVGTSPSPDVSPARTREAAHEALERRRPGTRRPEPENLDDDAPPPPEDTDQEIERVYTEPAWDDAPPDDNEPMDHDDEERLRRLPYSRGRITKPTPIDLEKLADYPPPY